MSVKILISAHGTYRDRGIQQHCFFRHIRRGDVTESDSRGTLRLYQQRFQRVRRNHRHFKVMCTLFF